MVKQWYEVLLARHDDWRPAVEDIREDNYEAVEFRVPRLECDTNKDLNGADMPKELRVSLMDVVSFFMKPLPGMRRPLCMFDIIHMCKHELRKGVLHHGYLDLLLVPRERVREFKQLSSMAPKADARMPELCVVVLSTSFNRSFTKS